MQVLLLQLGGQHYALETREVVRVLPAMRLVALPRAPAFIAGIMNYHGTPVPVLDLTLIAAIAGVEASTDTGEIGATGKINETSRTSPTGAAVDGDDRGAGAWFDTRIVLVERRDADGRVSLLGLRAEHVTGTRLIDPSRIAPSGVRDDASRFLGRVLVDETPMRQLIALAQLLPPHVTRWLHGRMEQVAC